MEPQSQTLRLRFMRRIIACLLATSALLTSCAESSTPGDEGDGEPSLVAPALDAKWRGTMTVTPAEAIQAQRLALRFASERERGIAYSLSSWGEEGWTVAYYLTSDWA